jgi:glycosyltransferase involved in cell wall biosynthesis
MIETVVVEDVPNDQAIQMIREAHLVVDQVLVGWYGGIAVEAMRMGRPVAVFIREEDLTFIPERMKVELRDSIINITPDSMEATLEQYIDDPSLLVEKSKAALDYVHRWHDPEYVAGITKAVYEGSRAER